MRIAIINPKADLINSNQPFRDFLATAQAFAYYNQFWTGYSNALLALASVTPDDFDVTLIDENHQPIPEKITFDIVAVSATTRQATRAYQIARFFKEKYGDRVITVMGGAHASFLPLEAGQHFDVVFIGEAEYSWPAFLEDVRKRKWRPQYSSAHFPTVDLATLPTPRFDKLNPAHSNMIWIQSSRGCPHNCEFCSAVRFFGRKIRVKQETQIIDEIQAALKHLPHRKIMFSDDNLLFRGKDTRSLMAKVKNLGISFMAQADISIGRDPEYLAFLKECGCSLLLIGLESIDARNLSLIDGWKHGQLKRYEEYIGNIARAGIGVYGAFIIGYDWDTPNSLHRLSQFMTDNFIAGAQISMLTPFPGTVLRSRLEAEGRILDTGWENYTLFDVNIKHPTLTTEELERELVQMYQSICQPEYLERKNRFYKEIYKNMLRNKIDSRV